MYIQITTRCNMTCEHCCFSCTAKGDDMNRETFLAAAKLLEDHDDNCVTIGGGEPTMHPLFWDFVGIALAHTEYQHLCIITNGKITSTALKLAKMAHSGILGAEISRDIYHDPIDERVVQAFAKSRTYSTDYRDLRGIRSAEGHVSAFGRAITNDLVDKNDCVCDDLFITPDGAIWACAHKELQFGTVFNPDIPKDYWQWDSKCSVRQLELAA